MPIICAICKKEFAKQINNTHLKSHNISAQEYKIQYGVTTLLSPEYKIELSNSRSGKNNGNWGKHWNENQREKMSETKSDTPPWNKNLKIKASDALLASIKNREEKYKSGELKRNNGGEWTDERRENHSKIMSNWTQNRSAEERSASAKLALKTKMESGHDLAFFRNKKHNDNTKQLISNNSLQHGQHKRTQSALARLQLIDKSGLELLNQENKILQLRCKTCFTEFSLTQQCFTESKWKIQWCNTCYPPQPQYRSTGECELFDWVHQHCTDAVSSHRQILSNKREIDIYVPSKQLAIEYNGLYWHSAEILLKMGKSPTSDSEKRQELLSKNIRYIGIFEDEWLHSKDIVQSRLRNLLGITSTKIGARSTQIKEVSSKDATEFCNLNHISGAGRSNVRYGLYHNDKLVSVMTFSKNNISRKINSWEINRYCSILDTTIIGGATKLFSKFVKDHNPENVISYADSRWSEGDLYRTLGFTLMHQTVPNYWYVPPGRTHRIHRFTLRKTSADNPTLTEWQNRQQQGYSIVYDCGSTKWLWTNQKKSQ